MATRTTKGKTKAASRRPAGKRAKPGQGRAGKAGAGKGRGAKSRSGGLRPDDQQTDLIGLGLVALGVFLACVVYLGWAGGQVGEALTDGFGFLVGLVAYAAPVVLVIGGTLVVMRQFVPRSQPFTTGAILLFCAATLALAAGTFGLGPGGSQADRWDATFLQERGGVAGEALFTVAAGLVQTIGAHIIAVFLALAGVLILTGATVGGVVQAMRDGVADTGDRLRTSTAELQARMGRPERTAPVSPPEPGDRELIVRATHVEAPPLEDDELYPAPDLFRPTEPSDRPLEEPEPEDDDLPTGSFDSAEEPGAVKVGEDAVIIAPVNEAAAAPDPEDLTPQGRLRSTVTEADDFVWRLPRATALTRSKAERTRPDTSAQQRIATQLTEALGHFGIEAKVIGTVTGPHITRYELRLAPGVKMSKVAQLKDDLAYALAAQEIRILAPIPGKTAVGVEVPNADRKNVLLGDVFQPRPKEHTPLTVWLGKDVAGKSIGIDLARMPHLLVAGTTGAGKSSCINSMLASVLLSASPQEVRMVLVDPKQVELNHYESIPHLLTPVITSPRMAANALQNLVREMEARYGLMSLARTRSLPELNRARAKRHEPALPYMLCVIDELADLMMVAPADVEDSIIRLAQKARAVGIHLVLATQSPRVDVITGMIKANVPSRIAFAVSSQTDSRVILDQNGAESLLGQGDMLFSPVGTSKLQRIQGAYIDEGQIEKIVEFWSRQGEPEFHEELLEEVIEEKEGRDEEDGMDPDEDPLLGEAISLVAQMQTASTSMLQRRLRLGYTRAGRLIDMLERRGVISGYEGSKPRQVLLTEADVPRVLASLGGRAAEPVTAEVPAVADHD